MRPIVGKCLIGGGGIGKGAVVKHVPDRRREEDAEIDPKEPVDAARHHEICVNAKEKNGVA